MQIVPSFVLAAGLAAAVASPVFAERPLSAGRLTDLGVERERVDGASPRGGQNFAGAFVTMRDELENFPVDIPVAAPGLSAPPTLFTGPPGFDWPNNNISGQSINYVRLVDLAGAPVSGANGVTNASKALRIRTSTAQAPSQFFFGSVLRFGWSPGELTIPLEPIPGVNARVSAEHWISTVDQLFTFEPIGFTGFITGRLLWGGMCEESAECADLGIPVGTVSHMYAVAPNPAPFTPVGFVPATYCQDANGNPIPACTPPPGFEIGDPVPPPIQNWFRLAGETTADGRSLFLLDLLDGSPEAVIYHNIFLTSSYIDRIGWNTSFESQGALMLIDNIEASGPVFQFPKEPPFECPYIDDIEWLNPGPLLGQNTGSWFAELSSAATVVQDGGNRFVRQVNDVSPDNRFREEMRAGLPNSYSLQGFPWTLCFEAATTTGLNGNTTARAFSIDSEATDHIPGGVTARIFLGITDPDTGIADSTIYVQTNPEYDPTDIPADPDPLGNAPVVGVDVVSTGVQWPADDRFRQVCVTVDNDGEMRITLNGVYIHWGGEAFSNAASMLRVESENTATGAGARLDLDDLEFDCHPLPQVFVPELLTPFLDRMDWAVNNVPPNRHIDDLANSPYESTRFTNVDGVLAREHPDYYGRVHIPNRLRNTTHIAPPDYNQPAQFIFTQFAMVVPSIEANAGTGWRVEATFAITDLLTSRGIAPAQRADIGDAHEPVGYLWISAVDQKVYLFASPENATSQDHLLNIDTGYTIAQLGVEPGEPVSVIVWYNRNTGLVEWLMNGVHLGATFPIVGTDQAGGDRVHKNLDAMLFLGGNDDTAASGESLSTMVLDSLHILRRDDCPDASGDGMITFHDLNAVLSNYGATGLPSSGFNPGDADGDGDVDFADLNAVLSAYGTSCE